MRYLIILPYIRAINGSLETITLALESINTFFLEDHEIIVAGEKPDFVKDYPNVRWIYKPDESEETSVNIVSQLYYMLDNYGKDYDCFIFWQDDIVAVNRFSIEDLFKTLAVDEEVITGRYTTNFYIRDREFILEAGDSIYFNPTLPHGQRAVDGDGSFLTVINERMKGKR